MNEDIEKNLSAIASTNHSKKELNNFQCALEILWQGFNLYHLKKIKGEEFLIEDKQIIEKSFEDFKAFLEPIIT